MNFSRARDFSLFVFRSARSVEETLDHSGLCESVNVGKVRRFFAIFLAAMIEISLGHFRQNGRVVRRSLHGKSFENLQYIFKILGGGFATNDGA